ncbi:hypothetical protein [Enterococcus alishanensis]|uniref:DUF5648 domain-containing protein n=1 Tax=Enterococcus alishanensis TaxID=1303817 RepID=A0ABS6TEF3_9ENTE|nr:hypothetical protein [Enterococcus alishanensis]MBV7391273.1 hypothetical protein [Enterococcus alishanensis]
MDKAVRQVTDPITIAAELVMAIANATGGTESDLVEIIFWDTITLDNPIVVSKSTSHVLLKSQNGSTIISRNAENTQEIFSVNDDAGLTLESITVDGGNNYTVEYVSGSLTVNPTTNPDPDPNPSDPDRLPLYRVYNKNDGEHLYTLSRPEAQGLINLGWQDEGIGWYGGETTGIAAYRLYNPNSGEHFYTLDRAEYDSVGQAGWNKEGIAFYAAENTEIPIHRLFNPNARDAGSHHYTLSLAENAHLIREGWRSEGVGFFGK